VSEKIERRLNNSEDEKPSTFKMWRSDSTKTELSKERSMDIESMIRQNCNEKVEEGLNKLYNMENRTQYMLESMSYYFDSCPVALPGLATYLLDISKDVKIHSNEIVKHMQDHGFTVVFEDITKPSESNWETPLTLAMTCLDVLKSMNEFWLQLHNLCVKYEDPCTEKFMKKFICGHMGLIKDFGSHVINLKRIGEDDGTGVYFYDLNSFKFIPNVDIDTVLH
jgi:ferritin